MFGISFGEALLLVLIAIVVVGPRDLPGMMRSLGRNISKLRRTANDLRSQSGIDDILQGEGLHQELKDFQKLATGRIMEIGLHEPLLSPDPRPSPSGEPTESESSDPYTTRRTPPRRREYPSEGPDTYGATTDETSEPRAEPPPSAPAPKIQAPEGAVARGSLDADNEANAAQ